MFRYVARCGCVHYAEHSEVALTGGHQWNASFRYCGDRVPRDVDQRRFLENPYRTASGALKALARHIAHLPHLGDGDISIEVRRGMGGGEVSGEDRAQDPKSAPGERRPLAV